VTILHHSEIHCLVLNKPAGLLTHPNTQKDEPRSLLTCHYDLQKECYRWGPDGREHLYLVHRLDSATSGLLLTTRSPHLATELRKLFESRSIKKIYRAIAYGSASPSAAQSPTTWQDVLTTSRSAGQLRTRVRPSSPSAAPAITHVKFLGTGTRGPLRLTALEMKPETGRPHQLRVQAAHHRLPLLGDQTYGDFAANREWTRLTGSKRLMLHAWKITLPAGIISPSPTTFTAPLPPEFTIPS
jgi:23S rRNA-/tRNA-specific pseudouridylate synthase